MLWEVVQLPRPMKESQEMGQNPSLSIWEHKDDDPDDPLRAFILNPEAVKYYTTSADILFYPCTSGAMNLRNIWYMRRHRRPIVPAPTTTPMPDNAPTPEDKYLRYSVYMRPWVLDREHALDPYVPHLADLRQDEGCSAKLVALRPRPNEVIRRLGNGTLPGKWCQDMQHRSFDNFMRSIVVNREAKKKRMSTVSGEARIVRNLI